MRASISSESLAPSASKNLMPLSSYRLCDALMTTPKSHSKRFVMYAMPGVGNGPISMTLTPAATKPASSAASNM